MTPTLNADWIELLDLLDAHQVEFIVIGAFAMAFHGLPRYTGDLDLFVNPSRGAQVFGALQEFGAPVGSLSVADLNEPGFTLTFGFPPRRVDILNWVSGLTWEAAWADAVVGEFGGRSVRFLSRQGLIANKRAAGRPQDLADIVRLEGIR